MGNFKPQPYFQYNKWLYPEKHFGPNYSGPFINPRLTDIETESFAVYKNRTIIENNLSKMDQFKDRDCLGIRKKISENKYEPKYTFYKYGEVKQMSTNVAKNLHAQSHLLYEDTYNSQKFKLIGIFAKNCVEWVLTDTACQMDSITTVTLYSTLGHEAFRHICTETNISTIFVSPELVDFMITCKEKFNITTLNNAILFDLTTYPPEGTLEKIQNAGMNAISFKELLKENTEVDIKELQLSKPDTVMTICYTSGTTGKPKGVMVIQRNMISMLEICIKDSGIPLDEHGSHISFLPLAHIMERIILSGFMSVAARIGFISGSVKTTLLEDIENIQPTCLFLVPKVLQNFKAKIFEKFNNLTGVKKRLVFKALETKRKNFKKYGIIKHALYDKIVFSSIRKLFGGNLLCILSASAPLPQDLAEDFKIMLSVPLVEGWGMTELAGPAFATHFSDLTNNTAGGVIGTSYLKLVDVPELGYTHDRVVNGVNCPTGEICIKGLSTCIGYYKNPEENAKAFDEEGYLHTGDVGMITPYGNGIKIIDRVKEIFKLSQGEYIIPAKLECVYEKASFVQNISIYGNSLMNHIIGIVFADKKKCIEFLKEKGVEEEDNWNENELLIREMRGEFERLLREANFNSLERLTYFIISKVPPTVENGCMTPTMKLVRKKIEEKFKEEIDDLYNKISVNRTTFK